MYSPSPPHMHTYHTFTLTHTHTQNEHVSTGTLLHLLAFVGRHEAVEWLLKNGAYVHSKNEVSVTRPQVTYVFDDPLPYLAQDGSTPLHVAALNHHPETIRVLRFYHADAHTENKVTMTVCQWCGWGCECVCVCSKGRLQWISVKKMTSKKRCWNTDSLLR